MASVITPLAEARDELGIPRTEVARALGADYSHLYQIERGEAQASPDLANRLANYLAERGATVTRDQILFPRDYMKTAKKPSRSVKGTA